MLVLRKKKKEKTCGHGPSAICFTTGETVQNKENAKQKADVLVSLVDNLLSPLLKKRFNVDTIVEQVAVLFSHPQKSQEYPLFSFNLFQHTYD